MEHAHQSNELREATVVEYTPCNAGIIDAIEKLRSRLLDLSARNSLINYKHPKGRCIQIADEPNINQIFDRIYNNNKTVLFKHVPIPEGGKQQEAWHYASSLGLSTSFQFQKKSDGEWDSHQKSHAMQTLLYPEDLERQLRKISKDARMVIEETGSNMLFLIFGFLEFYDSEDSERPMLAPILSLPVTLIHSNKNRETGFDQYTVEHNGEDLAENQTLQEKLAKDFRLFLPTFGEEDKPDAYFRQVEEVIKNKHRWKVRRQITLGMLSFGKLAMWADLDTKKNPALTRHGLIQSIFSGEGNHGSSFYAEDYPIDKHPEYAAQPLIYDADSSQHSAIIDVLAGKNLVINGPPGTGKSQTITNIIAAALAKGKKILFVSEKLAALEVVRHRLDRAGLGHFCLELHSHKTQKKKFLEDIKASMEARFPQPKQFEAKLETLQREKNGLARHAELMGSRVGNALGLTVNEVFWAVAQRKQALGDLAEQASTPLFLDDASTWSHDDITRYSADLDTLAEAHSEIKTYSAEHPWWGFDPKLLSPSDDDKIAAVVRQALQHAETADSAANELINAFGFKVQPDIAEVSRIKIIFESELNSPEGIYFSLLPKMFDPKLDPTGQTSAKSLLELRQYISEIKKYSSASQPLIVNKTLTAEETNETKSLIKRHGFSKELLSIACSSAIEMAKKLGTSAIAFKEAAQTHPPVYCALEKSILSNFLASVGHQDALRLKNYPINFILQKTDDINQHVAYLLKELSELENITTRWKLPFDATPEAIVRLKKPDYIELKPIPIDKEGLEEAKRLSMPFLAQKSVDEIQKIKQQLDAYHTEWGQALARCAETSTRLGLPFDATEKAITELAALAEVAANAPEGLLTYRKATFGQPAIVDLIEKTKQALAEEKQQRAALESIFYLDALPPVVEIKAAMATLRTKDGFLAIFDSHLRNAKKLHTKLSKTKQKHAESKCAEQLADLASWMDKRDSLISNQEMKETFGGLFKGLETNTDKIEQLYDWYQSAKRELAGCLGLMEKINLSTIPSDHLAELAAKSAVCTQDIRNLKGINHDMHGIFGTGMPEFDEASTKGLRPALDFIRKLSALMEDAVRFFSSRADTKYSQNDILHRMHARAALDSAKPILATLESAERTLREVGGEAFIWLTHNGGGSWKSTLEHISKRASQIHETAKVAQTFSVPSAHLATAELFAKKKWELDTAWAEVAPIPAWDQFESWQALAEAAYTTANDAKKMLDIFASVAKPNMSAQQIDLAVANKSKAIELINHIKTNPELNYMQERALKDEAGLSETHQWGRHICALNLPQSIKNFLLSDQGASNLKRLKDIYKTIDFECEQTQEKMKELTSFGSFDWERWQATAPSTKEGDTPSKRVARLFEPANNPKTVLSWAKYIGCKAQIQKDGFGEFITKLESNEIPAIKLAKFFELVAYQSIGRSIYENFPELKTFNGLTHEKMRSHYCELDVEIISLTGKIFGHQIKNNTSVPKGETGFKVGDNTEDSLLRREVNKKSRYLPIRQLVKRAGKALQAYKPCFMMGPLSVAQYLAQNSLTFDLVVMDEASQLRPEDAIGAIARGTQLVVVGDPKQLPPTNFFDRMTDTEDDEDEDEKPVATNGMESILDICEQLFTPVRSLRWHYRSQHESLIAFSNHHFYKNLIVFPSPYAKNRELGVKYHYIRDGIYQNRQNLPEARRVVDAALEHMIKHPNESLGIVTLNQTQRELIEELFHKKSSTFIESTNFRDEWESKGWPFFIKNLENVQGDERDVIFISTTFGKVAGTDRVRQNFGPISRPDGWRRLNVLFTRAKRRIDLFTSMGAEDIVVNEDTTQGTKALRDYLDFAKRGVLTTTDEKTRDPDSDFEITVANIVSSLGYEVKPQLGVAGFFIDMAIRNPNRPGEFLAGIECDGATYHSGFSVRDRDRIRQEILESLGWRGRIYRIWSTDWFYNQANEIKRLKEFLQERQRISSAEILSNEEEEEENEEEMPTQIVDETTLANEQRAVGVAEASGDQDLFVEIGDRVTYCSVDNPADRHSVFIVDSTNNVNRGFIHETTPLAQVLLNLSAGDEGELEISGYAAKKIRVLKVQRQKDFLE